MNRLLAGTAVSLLLGLAPAAAETQVPPPHRQDQPALDQSAQPSQPIPAQPSNPNAALPGNPDAANEDQLPQTPGQSSEMAPESSPSNQALPSDHAPPSIGEAIPPSQSSEMAPGGSPSGQASPSDQSSPPAIGQANPPSQSSEIPKSPESPKSAEAPSGTPFLAKQESSDWLVGNLIGKSVVNADNESIGNVNDLVTDQNGKLIAIVIGAGGFLGIGEKDVAIRFEDIKLARDENNDVKVIADISKEIIASAPDYQTLDEQQLTVGERSDQDTSR